MGAAYARDCVTILLEPSILLSMACIGVMNSTPTLQYEMSPLYTFGRDETTAGDCCIFIVVIRDGRAPA